MSLAYLHSCQDGHMLALTSGAALTVSEFFLSPMQGYVGVQRRAWLSTSTSKQQTVSTSLRIGAELSSLPGLSFPLTSMLSSLSSLLGPFLNYFINKTKT